MRKLIFATALLLQSIEILSAQQLASNSDIRIIPVKGNIWMLAVGGSNVVASIGKDGILLVNTGSAAMSGKLAATLQELNRNITSPKMPQKSCVGMVQGCTWWSSSTFTSTTVAPPAPKPIVGIINTSFDLDHAGGNATISAAGHSHVGVAAQSAWIIAHEKANPLLREDKSSKAQAFPQQALPTETYDSPKFKLNHFNGEGVVLWHMPNAHTDGDTVVQFRESDVLVAGDILNMTSYPVIDVNKGGSIQGVVDALNWLLDTAVVEHMMEGGTIIIPGHGRLTDSADLAYYRDMMSIIRDRVRAAAKQGMNLDQIKAAKLTRDYDGRFGRNLSYTPDMLIEAVYKSLDVKPESGK